MMFNDRASRISRPQLLQMVIASTLIVLFSVACGNTTATSVPEAPAATSTPVPPTPMEEPKPEEIVAAEESAIDGPRSGDAAPDFALTDSNGNIVRLADELQDNEAVVLVFFHSHQ